MHWWPVRLAFGLFFLHTALEKRALDEQGIKGVHRFASTAYPPLKDVPPATFVRGMMLAESAIAASLLVPVVPVSVGAAGLTAFGVGLMGTYARTPGMRHEGSIRPTPIGQGLAKDAWMVAAGAAMLIDAARSRRR